MRSIASFKQLAFTTTRRQWVVEELDRLIAEWRAWQQEVEAIVDHPYDRQTQLDVFADGEANMQKHRILQTKTETFLDNNLEGHGFIHGREGQNVDRTDLRLKVRVKHRIASLEELRASIEYAKVPDAFWLAQAKKLVDKLTDDPAKSAESIAKALKDPFSI